MKSELALELQRQHPRMYRVALRIVGSHEEASEVVQIASLKSWRSIDAFQGESSLGSWLYRITRNAALDQLHKIRRTPVSLSDVAQYAFESRDGDQDRRRMEDRELFEIAMWYVEQLPDDCRESFVLSQLDGYSYQQISEIQNVPPGTVASRIHRAKQLLCDQLRKHC